jgi:hypothetical protein
MHRGRIVDENPSDSRRGDEMKKSRIDEICTKAKVTVVTVVSTVIFIAAVISFGLHEIVRLLK